MIERTTVVISDRLAHHRVTFDAALHARHGRSVTTMAGLAARLAGPFIVTTDDVTVRRALSPVPSDKLDGLASVSGLPGFPRAAANTLQSAWNADLDLAALAHSRGERWAEIAALERQVLDRLPAGMLGPREVVDAALARMANAPNVLGDVVLDGLGDVPLVYRRLIAELADHVSVTWLGLSPEPPFEVPEGVRYVAPESHEPRLSRIACADPHHEVVEAFRWARELVANSVATPDQIAIAAASAEPYEDAVFALAQESALPVHAPHGMPALGSRDGQVAAALADVLMRGLDRHRVQRFVALARGAGSGAPDLAELSDDWSRVLPRDAPLSNLDRWERGLAPAGDEYDPTREKLRELGTDLARGTAAAAEIGERWLRGRPRLLWRRALDEGPPAAIDVSLGRLRVDDGVDPATAILWASPSALAGSPREHVRLLGLASRSWPRRSTDDPLLPRHVLGDAVLHERTLAEMDRRHFHAILRRTAGQIVFSRARRDAEGRKLAPSPLLRNLPTGDEVPLMPRRLPQHAFSEGDRRLARPNELARDAHARDALTTWHAWLARELTAHDGIVRANHPAVERALDRIHSATSFRVMLRNPIAYVWHYALGWSEPSIFQEALVLDALQRGLLLHQMLERAVGILESGATGLGGASSAQVEEAAQRAMQDVADAWSIEQSVPPEVLWRAALEEARSMTITALTLPLEPLEGQRSFVEVRFGRSEKDEAETTDGSPWVASTEVRIADDRLRIAGSIDRLDLSGDGRRARVLDYKSSRSSRRPASRAVDIDEGKELQRCLYAFAVRDLLPGVERVDAMLVYPFSERTEQIADPEGTLAGLASCVTAAVARLREGYAVHGPDAENSYFDLRLALPADFQRGYLQRKKLAVEDARAPIDAILFAEPGAEPGGGPGADTDADQAGENA